MLRRPLTTLEEELDLLERSAMAKTIPGQARIEVLSAEVEKLAIELRPTLDEIQDGLDAMAADLSTAQLKLVAGDANVSRFR